MVPLTKPSVCSTSCLPLFRKSPILTSQHQPVQASPICSACCEKGAMPLLRSCSISLSSLVSLTQAKLDSSRPQATSMLLTTMSNLPLLLRSPKSTPIPLNDPLPSTKDFGVVGVRWPLASVKEMWPGVDRL